MNLKRKRKLFSKKPERMQFNLSCNKDIMDKLNKIKSEINIEQNPKIKLRGSHGNKDDKKISIKS